MKKYFVTGENIAHSFSPFIYNKIFLNYRYNAEFIAIENNISSFPSFIRNLSRNGFSGGAITMPFKKMAYYLVDRRDRNAIETGYVNFVEVIDGEIVGYNRDYIAAKNIIDRLRAKYINLEYVTILGNGATAAAIYEAAPVCFKVRKISLRSDVFFNDDKEHLLKTQLLINTTPCSVNFAEKNEFLSKIKLDTLQECKIVMDVIYNPVKTILLEKAESLGLEIVNGLEFLAMQAVGVDDISLSIDDMHKIYDMLCEINRVRNIKL